MEIYTNKTRNILGFGENIGKKFMPSTALQLMKLLEFHQSLAFSRLIFFQFFNCSSPVRIISLLVRRVLFSSQQFFWLQFKLSELTTANATIHIPPKEHYLLAKENQRQTERKLVCFWIMRKAVDGTRTMKETTVAWKDLIPGMLKLLAKVHQILLCLAFS